MYRDYFLVFSWPRSLFCFRFSLVLISQYFKSSIYKDLFLWLWNLWPWDFVASHYLILSDRIVTLLTVLWLYFYRCISYSHCQLSLLIVSCWIVWLLFDRQSIHLFGLVICPQNLWLLILSLKTMNGRIVIIRNDAWWIDSMSTCTSKFFLIEVGCHQGCIVRSLHYVL